MKPARPLITLIVAATLATPLAALAHGRDHHGWRDHHHHSRHHGHVVHLAPQPYVLMPSTTYYYRSPGPVYLAPPRHRAPQYYEYGRADRRVGQVVGAVAGGVIGHVAGDGRLLPTAVGAVIGGVVGGELAE